MPYTLAHPAAILPFRRWLPPISLALGSMAPDFEYILRGHIKAAFGHTLAAQFYFCVPISLLILFVLRRSKHALSTVCPPPMQPMVLHSLTPSSDRRWNDMGIQTVAILLGCASHLVCDSFTHRLGWPVQQIPLLASGAHLPFAPQLRVYHALHYVSSIAGLLCIAVVLRNAIREARPSRHHHSSIPPRIRLAVLILAALILSMVTCYQVAQSWSSSVQTIAENTALWFMIGCIAALVWTSGAVALWSRFSKFAPEKLSPCRVDSEDDTCPSP